MKITAIRATPVNILLEVPFYWSVGLYPGESLGLGFWCYSGDAGICTAAYLHVVAATEWIHEPSQSLFRWQVDDVIEQGPFRQTNNVIPVPEGPGLGVTLSTKGLKRCHQRFVDDGPMNHFFNPDNPGKFYRLPRN